MAQKMGRALLKRLRGEAERSRGSAREASLLNEHRRQVLAHLFWRPCSTASDISKVLTLSVGSVRWHLDKLTASGLLSYDGPYYYPRGLLDPEDVELFKHLSSERIHRILLLLAETQGISQSELAKVAATPRQMVAQVMSDLRGLGLISDLKDGRFLRYYITDVLAAKSEHYAAKARTYSEWLLHKLEDQGIEARVVRGTTQVLELEIGSEGARSALLLRLNPIAAIMSG